MARGFGTTLGGGATDYVQLVGGAGTVNSVLSWSLWTYRRVDGTMFMAFGGRAAIWTNGSVYIYQRDFSTTAGVWTWTMPATGAWVHIGVTHDGTATANNAVVYANGSSVSVTRFTAPVGTVVTTAQGQFIGSSAGSSVWDGYIGKVCRWDGVILSAAEMLALSKGISPFRIRRASVAYGSELEGVSGETTITATGGQASGTIVGTARANNPPVALTTPHVPAMPLYITQAKFSRPMQHLRAGSRQGM